MSMSKSDRKILITSVTMEYVKFDIPSDQIVASAHLKKRFAESVNSRLPLSILRLTPDACGKLLINLRKSGYLPRIRDGHGPPKGKKQGHV
jgi:hypothetical protein